MKVGFGCDHTAIDLKKELMAYMAERVMSVWTTVRMMHPYGSTIRTRG